MSDHADTVRAFIEFEDDWNYEPSDEAIRLGIKALAALDALVAERDEARRALSVERSAVLDDIREERERAEAAEAERDRYKAALERIADPEQEPDRIGLGKSNDAMLPYAVARAALSVSGRGAA